MTSHLPKKLVIVESPFAAGNGYTVEQNIEYARAALRDCLMRGEAPFASHLLYTQPGVLDDNIRAERSRGIAAGLSWASVASKTVVYMDHGLSKGMMLGIARAKQSLREIEYRTVPEFHNDPV